MAKEFRRGSEIDGFMNFSVTPFLELLKLMISMVATVRWDQVVWFGQRGHERFSQIVMTHTDISRAYFHVVCREERYVELPPTVWSEGYPENGRFRVSLYGTRDAAACWEDAYATEVQEHLFERGGFRLWKASFAAAHSGADADEVILPIPQARILERIGEQGVDVPRSQNVEINVAVARAIPEERLAFLAQANLFKSTLFARVGQAVLLFPLSKY